MEDNKKPEAESIDDVCYWYDEFKRTDNSFLSLGTEPKKICKECNGYKPNCIHYISHKIVCEDYHAELNF